MKKNLIIVLIIVLAALAVSIYFYPQMPEQVASHWNIKGEVDGYLPKFWGAFLMPLMMLATALLLLILPKIDPLKANVEKFKKYYHGFILVLLIFLFFIHLQVILWSLPTGQAGAGFRINPAKTMPVGVGALFFFAGILCEKAKQNWFIGIRTPWTLANEKVWDKTHQIGGKLFKIAGLVAVVGIFFGEWSLYFIMIPAIVVIVFSLVFSYWEYRRETAKK